MTRTPCQADPLLYTDRWPLMTTAFAVAKDDAVGAVVVAEFTDVEMLRHSAVLGNDPPGVRSRWRPSSALSCRPVPAKPTFAWTACDEQPMDDGEVWRGIGGGPDADGLGVTLVRTDGSGLSITLSTTAFTYVGYARAYESESLPTTTPPPPPRLKELPLTHDALAEIVTSLAASGAVFSVEALPMPATEDPTYRTACATRRIVRPARPGPCWRRWWTTRGAARWLRPTAVATRARPAPSRTHSSM